MKEARKEGGRSQIMAHGSAAISGRNGREFTKCLLIILKYNISLFQLLGFIIILESLNQDQELTIQIELKSHYNLFVLE